MLKKYLCGFMTPTHRCLFLKQTRIYCESINMENGKKETFMVLVQFELTTNNWQLNWQLTIDSIITFDLNFWTFSCTVIVTMQHFAAHFNWRSLNWYWQLANWQTRTGRDSWETYCLLLDSGLLQLYNLQMAIFFFFLQFLQFFFLRKLIAYC
jgi:hypothetical protein